MNKKETSTSSDATIRYELRSASTGANIDSDESTSTLSTLSFVEEDEEMATQGDSDLTKLLSALVQAQTKSEQARAEEERKRNKREKEEEKRRQDDEKRMTKLFEQQAAQNRDMIETMWMKQQQQSEGNSAERETERAISQLPRMKDKDEIEKFCSTFEQALILAEIPKNKWKRALVFSVNNDARDRVKGVLEDEASTYDDVKAKLLDSVGISVSLAYETMFDPDSLSTMATRRETRARTATWAERMFHSAETKKECIETLQMAKIITSASKEGRKFLYQNKPKNLDALMEALETWEAIHKDLTSIWEKPRNRNKEFSNAKPKDKTICSYCNKFGHSIDECRKKARRDSEKPQPAAAPSVPYERSQKQGEQKEVICHNCGEKGHKSPVCPNRSKKKAVKKISVLQSNQLTSPTEPTPTATNAEELKKGHLMAKVNGYYFPMTLDSGASISLIPEEFVPASCFTGKMVTIEQVWSGAVEKGREAYVWLQIGTLNFETRVCTAKGVDIAWTGVLSLPLDDEESRAKAVLLGIERQNLVKDKLMFIPPRIANDILYGAEFVLTDRKRDLEVPLQSEVLDLSDRSECGSEDAELEDDDGAESAAESGIEDTDVGPVGTQLEPKDLNEDSIERKQGMGGSVDNWLQVKAMKEVEGIPLDMVVETRKDDTLLRVRKLADLEKRGYKWENGLVKCARLDVLGKPMVLTCLPKPFREDVLRTAHEQFGHGSKRRVTSLIAKRFWWPTMYTDIAAHCKQCETCQRTTKRNPKPAPMVPRETVTVPFEKVCVDIVGPFPQGKGGFRYIVTYIDVATRWPDAVPIRKQTARAVLDALDTIFTRTRYPRTMLADNGTQFTGKDITQYCSDHGIHLVHAAPYHPQTNGIVERMHGTLKPMLHKQCQGKKGCWPEVLKHCLHFMRMTPTSATGVSPFHAAHGFEGDNPLDVLHEAWVSPDLKNMDVSAWVAEHTEAVQAIRENITLQNALNNQQRKQSYDKRAKHRTFEVGDLVLWRTPGMDAAMVNSWEGPFKVVGKLTDVTYELDTGRKKKRVSHVNALKKFEQKEEIVAIKRITTAIEDDTVEDCLDTAHSRSELVTDTLSDKQLEDLSKIEKEFEKCRTKMPGFTTLTECRIQTSDSQPIAQHPYRVPDAHREGVEKEIQWLLENGIIRESDSMWASPMVTATKPNGSIRVCVDFRKLNAITPIIPFYMPTVDEIIDALGTAQYISTIDLSKGFYQVGMDDRDVEKTAFMCPQGKYEFVRMPFGLKNAPAVFQTLLGKVLKGLGKFVRHYIDDIVIFSQSWEEHIIHIREVMKVIDRAGLTVNPDKCRWAGKEVIFLGHRVGRGRCAVPEVRVAAIRDFARPVTRKALRSFLGMVSYYRRYISMLAKQTAILSPATSKSAPPKVEWTEEMNLAFQSIRKSICDDVLLCIPTSTDRVSVVTDASGYGIGGILQVWREEKWRPAAFFSRQTRAAERRYSATELEALAMVETIMHFSQYLLGKQFVSYTDHKALCSLLTSDRLNPRLKRLSMKLSGYSVSVVYVPGPSNTAADALSRQEWEPDEATDQTATDLPVMKIDLTREAPSGAGECEGLQHHQT